MSTKTALIIALVKIEGQGATSNLKFLFSNGTDTENITRWVSWGGLNQVKLNFHLTKLNVSKLASISVFPLASQGTSGGSNGGGSSGGGGGGSSGGGGGTSCTPNCAGKNCGDDGCGGNCGTCINGYSCNVTIGVCELISCTPKTCSGLGYLCGNWSDGCGSQVNCGTCSSGTCDSSGKCVSSCTPLAANYCSANGHVCGYWGNGTCSGNLNCNNPGCGLQSSCSIGTCICNSGFSDCNNDNSCECNLATSSCIAGNCVANPSICNTSTLSWQNNQLASQNGVFTVVLNSTPNNNNMDGVLGLSQGTQSAYSGFSVLIRYNVSGYIQAYDTNSLAYRSETPVPYTAGMRYAFRIVVDFTSQTFNLYITPQGGSQTLLASNYKFRTPATLINNWGMIGNTFGTFNICDFNIASSIPNPSCAPTTCSALGYECGTPNNGTCGGTLNCNTPGCGSQSSCSSGTCVCNSGFADCNNDNSCECNLASNSCSGGTCVASAGGSPPVIGMVASRLTGVAPLGIFFDATGTTSTATIKPFHELDYTWNFGDDNNKFWAMSGKSKNAAKGPVAAHIFENPGAYTVTLNVKDMNGATSSTTVTINVLSQPAVGWTTYCFANTNDFSYPECNSAIKTVTNSFNIASIIAPNVRILFKRGDTFTATSTININRVNGPGLIGAYGTCVNPNARGICSNAPMITTSSGVDPYIQYDRSTDWKIIDLKFTGGAVVSGLTDMYQLLFLRVVDTNAPSVGIGNSIWNTLGEDQYMIVDSEISDAMGNQVYIGSERLVLLGNSFINSHTSHVVRIWQAYKAVISNNVISGSSLDNLNGRHALKLHGPGEEFVIPDAVGSDLAHRTQYVVVSDNLFGASGPWPVGIGPQDAFSNEKIRDVIVERNQFLSNYGIFNNIEVGISLLVWSSNVSVRNNIFDGSHSSSGYSGVYVGQRGIEGFPTGVTVDNNVVYTSTQNTNEIYFVNINSADTTRVSNNIFYAPNDATQVYAFAGSNYNSQTNLFQTNPSFVNPSNEDFHISSNSPAKDAGTSVAVFEERRLKF